MWRPPSISFSRYTRSPPNAARASACASAYAVSTSAAERATRMPRPPPPFSALNSTGKPTSAATRRASAASARTPSLPGITASPAARIAAFALVLLDISAVTCGGGPMNVTPCCAHSVASSGFSDRKPQPGCSALQCVCTAAWTTRIGSR